MMTTTRFVLPGFACLWFLGACSGPETDLTSVESGIFEVQSWTLNEQHCNAPGPSVLEGKVTKYVVVGHPAS